MSRRMWVLAGVMTLAIAGAIAWAGIDAERHEHAEQAAEAAETGIEPGQVLGEHVVEGEGEGEPRPVAAGPSGAAPSAGGAPGGGPSVADDPERVRIAVEGARAIADEDIARQLTALEEEPRDEAWAAEQERELRAFGDGYATRGQGRVTDVRCRTQGCVVELVWPSYAAAQAEVHDVLGGAYGDACARELRIPMPQDPRLPYAGLMVLTCTRD